MRSRFASSSFAALVAISAISCSERPSPSPISPTVTTFTAASTNAEVATELRVVAISEDEIHPAAAKTFTLSGTIVEKVYPSWGVPKATISVSGGPKTTTDSKGKYSLKLPAGSHTIKISAKGYKSTSIKRSIKGTTKANLEVPVTIPSGATARCKDKTWSSSKNRSGTCSHHKGVAYWVCPGRLCK